MNRWFLILGVGILIAALAFLNQGIKKAAPTDADLQQAQQQSQPPAPAAPPRPAAPLKPSASPAALPAEETVGDPATATHHIRVGWVYDEANQAKPETLTGPLQAIRDYASHSGGTVSAEIVNLDVPAADRSPAARVVTAPGVVVDNKTLFNGSISETPMPPEQIARALDSAVGKK